MVLKNVQNMVEGISKRIVVQIDFPSVGPDVAKW